MRVVLCAEKLFVESGDGLARKTSGRMLNLVLVRLLPILFPSFLLNTPEPFRKRFITRSRRQSADLAATRVVRSNF